MLKNSLYQSKLAFKSVIKSLFLTGLMISFTQYHGQIANYVNNGSFEQMIDCNWNTGGGIYKAKYWRGVDSLFAPALASTCPGFNNVPLYFTYQWPKTGSNHALATWFCPPPSCMPDNNRSYFRNRLKKISPKALPIVLSFTSTSVIIPRMPETYTRPILVTTNWTPSPKEVYH